MDLQNNEAQNVELQNAESQNAELLEQQEQETESERYVRRDIEGGYIYNKSEISYYRQVQKLEVANNLMLGDYNQNGVYTLNEDLIKQLIGMTKVYQYSFGSNMFCQSLNDLEGFGKVDFAIKIVKDTPKLGSTTAVLELLEPIDKANGYYTNTNTVQIDIYTAQDSNNFVVDVLKKFNVVSKKDAGLIAKKHEENIDLIILRKRYEEMRKNMLSDKVEEIYKNNFNKKLKLLAKSPAGKKILEEFNKQSYKINGWFVKDGMKGYYKTMDELLQSIIDKNKSEVLQDVKLVASLNKLESECSKLLQGTINNVNKTVANPELYGKDVVAAANNQQQFDNQLKNENSKEREVKVIKSQTRSSSATKGNTVIMDNGPKTSKNIDVKKPKKSGEALAALTDHYMNNNIDEEQKQVEDEMIK